MTEANTDQKVFTGENPVLEFDNLDVKFKTEFGTVHAVKGLTLSVEPGEVMALVGESGSGKSVTATTALGLLPKTARITGETVVDNKVVGDLSGRELRAIRGRRVAMVFQEPMTALNPLMSVGDQVAEVLQLKIGRAHV